MAFESRQFVVVKFFGPGRKNGRLWGYVNLLDDSGLNQDIFVEEPKFGNQPIKGGEIRLVKVSLGRNLPILTDPSKWESDESGIRALEHHLQMLVTTKTGKELLKRLVPNISIQLCPETLILFHTDRNIAHKANQSPHEFVKLLRTSLEFGSGLEWVRQVKNLPKIGESDFFRIVDLFDYEVFDRKLARRLIVAQGGLTKELISKLAMSSEVWFPLLLENAESHVLVSTPEVLKNFSLIDQIEIVCKAASTQKGHDVLLSEIGADNLKRFLEDHLDSLEIEKIRKFESDFFYLFPFLLNPLDDGTRLSIYSKALEKNSPNSKVVSFFEEATLKILEKWSKADESCDWPLGAQRQADLLLKFPPKIFDQLVLRGGLLPELQHLLVCGPDSNCINSGNFRIRFSHAIGSLVLAKQANAVEFKSRLKLVERELLQGEHPEQVKADLTLAQLVESQVLGWLKDRVLEEKIGVLGRLLPRCTMGEAPFCEAKLPGVDPKTGQVYAFPFCPRTKKGCSAAIVKPDFEKSVSEWNLFELCGEARGDGRKTIINTLAGFVNRAFELSARRMTCLDCDGPLTFNPEYSRNYASYMTTVMRCSSSCGSNEVYLNHCFNCQRIIDSRESKHRDPSAKYLYLCITCANGLKPWCPACGNSVTEEGRGESRKCLTCGHRATRGTKEPIPRISLAFTPGPWRDCYIHQPENKNWSDRSDAKNLRLMADLNDGSDDF